MNFEQYVSRYKLLQMKITSLEKMEGVKENENYRFFADNFKKTNIFAEAEMESILRYDKLGKTVEKDRRLISKYALRMKKACDLIESAPIKEYALLRYVFGVQNEIIAEKSFYSVRTVYRHSLAAKKELEKRLLQVMPKAKRITKKRFFANKRMKVKDYTLSDKTINKLKFSIPNSVRAFRVRLERTESA